MTQLPCSVFNTRQQAHQDRIGGIDSNQTTVPSVPHLCVHVNTNISYYNQFMFFCEIICLRFMLLINK